MKKFIEDDVEIKFDSPIHVVQSAACLIITAPFKFIMTISGKILYLPQEAQRKVMLNSAVVASLILALNLVYQWYFNCFSLLRGKMPIVVLAVVTVILWVGYCTVSAANFSFHSQLESVLSQEEPGVQEEKEETKEEEVPDKVDEAVLEVDGAVSATSTTDEQLIDDLLNFDLTEDVKTPIIDTSKLESKTSLSKIGNNNGLLTDNELETLKEALDVCTDPSKFLSNKLLAKFRSDKIVEDDCNIESLNLGVIPNGFRVFA